MAGELDAAILWGPIAGYFAARAAPVPVAVVPLRSEPGIQFEFAMAAGVRFGERESRAQLEDLMARTAPATTALFAEYHIPLIEAPTELVYVTNEDAGTISVISTTTHKVIGEIPVGTRPRGVEVSRDGEHVYVALSGSPKCPPTVSDEDCAKLGADKTKDGIAVIDARRQAVLRMLAGRLGPGRVRRRRSERATFRLERGQRESSRSSISQPAACCGRLTSVASPKACGCARIEPPYTSRARAITP